MRGTVLTITSRRTFLAVVFALMLAPRLAVTEARAGALEALVPAARRVGKARFKVIFFKIYDAELFAPDGRFDRAGPYALRLTYLINAKKDRIVSQTVKEMKRQTSASNTQVES